MFTFISTSKHKKPERTVDNYGYSIDNRSSAINNLLFLSFN